MVAEDTYAETAAKILELLFKQLLPPTSGGFITPRTAEALALLTQLERDWPELAEFDVVRKAWADRCQKTTDA